MSMLVSQEEATERYGYERYMDGRKEGRIESVRTLMSTMNLTAEKAMDLLRIPESDREWYASALQIL